MYTAVTTVRKKGLVKGMASIPFIGSLKLGLSLDTVWTVLTS